MKTKNTLAIALALALAMILVPAASIIADDNSAGDSEFYNSGVVLGADPVDHVEWEDNAGSQTTTIRFYADGDAITVESATSNPLDRVLLITFSDGTTQTLNPADYGNQPKKFVNIFGGSKNASVASSSVTVNSGYMNAVYAGGFSDAEATPANVTTSALVMNGGHVTNAIYGGGLLYSTVQNATVTMNDGYTLFLMGGGACYLSDAQNIGTPDNPYPSITGKTTVNVNGGNADYVMGGGQGYALVNNSEINFNDGTAVEVIGSGSNGTTDNSVVNIRGGEVTDYVFSVNRGAVADSATINITGGTVANAYAGASQDSSNTTGKVTGSVSLNISGGDVSSIYVGTGINDANVNLNVGDRTIIAQGGFAANADKDYTIAPGKEWNIESGRLVVPSNGSITLASSADGRGVLNISDNATFTLDGVLNTDALNQINGKVQMVQGSELNYDFNGNQTTFASFGNDNQIKLNGQSAVMSFGPSSDFDPADPKATAVDIGLVSGSFSINADTGYTVTPDATLTVGPNATLTIPDNKTLYMYGDMTVDGTLINNGELQIVKSATNVPNYPGVDFGKEAGNLTVSETGTVVNRGDVTITDGTFTNNGSVSSTTPIPGVPNVKPLVVFPDGVRTGDTLIFNLDPSKIYDFSEVIIPSDIRNVIVNGNNAQILGLNMVVPDAGANVTVECLHFENRGLFISSSDISGQWVGDVTVRFNTFNNINEPANADSPIIAAIAIFGNTGSTICIDQNVINNVSSAAVSPTPSAKYPNVFSGSGIVVATNGNVADKSTVLIYSNSISNTEGDAIGIIGQFECVHINDNTIENWDSANLGDGRAISYDMSGYAAYLKVSYNTFIKSYVEPADNLNGNILEVINWVNGTPKVVFEYNTLNLQNLPASITGITDERLANIQNTPDDENIPKYTVDFDLNGGSWSLPTTGNFVTGGAGIDQPNVSPSKAGFYFAGWTLNGQAYEFGTPITSDITLVAAWAPCPVPQTYTVTFDSNGGSSVPSQTVNYGGLVTEPSAPHKDGFVFGGWYCDQAFTSPYNFCNPVYSSFTLYAKWVASGETCTVTFDADGKITQVVVVKGTPVEKPADPVKDGFTFTCWTLNGLPYNFNAPVNSDITLCANFVVGSYEQNGQETVVNVDNSSIADAVKDASEAGSDTFVLIDASGLTGTEIVSISTSALQTALDEMSSKGISKVNILLPQGSFVLDSAAISSILNGLGESVSFVIERADASKLSDAQAEAAGDRPVYEISIRDGDKAITSFGGSKIQVALAYDLKEGEDASKICVWYIDSDGKVQTIDATYENGYVIFDTDHASLFAVGYDSAAGSSNDNTIYYIFAAALVIILVACIAVFMMRKKQTI